MLKLGFLLVMGLTSVMAAPQNNTRIVGGSATTISAYPYSASLLYSSNLISYTQRCGGTLLTSRTILSAAQCFYRDSVSQWRVRLGSTWANSGGYVYTLNSIITHGYFNSYTLDYDVALLKTANTIYYISGAIQPATIAASTYYLADDQRVYAIGWGSTSMGGSTVEQLREVAVWTVNQSVCRSRYAELGNVVTENMLCSGWLDVGLRDQCVGDSGSPLIHNNVIVGICSWGKGCALPRYPGVNTRVSKVSNWIINHA